MISAEALDALLEAGATAEMIVAAVKAELKSANAAAVDRRTRDAARKRRERQCVKNVHDVRDVRRTPQDKLDKKEKHPPNEYISNPPEKKKTPSSPKGDGSPCHKTNLPAGWRTPALSLGSKSQRIVDGWPPGKLELERDKFCEHYTSRATRRADWDASWRSWVLKSEEFENGKIFNDNKRDIDAAARNLGFE
jgi:hypothetical protein